MRNLILQMQVSVDSYVGRAGDGPGLTGPCRRNVAAHLGKTCLRPMNPARRPFYMKDAALNPLAASERTPEHGKE